jgi:hypothetical protein
MAANTEVIDSKCSAEMTRTSPAASLRTEVTWSNGRLKRRVKETKTENDAR